MKRLLSFLLAFILLLVPFAAARGEKEPEIFTSGDFQYALLEDGTAEIRRYTGKTENLTIPDTLDGHPVTSIGYRAFYSCESLKNITLPDSVTAIGDYAFNDCSSLISITIPDSVTSIGHYAFSGSTSLASLALPDSVTSIGDGAFADCTSLSSLTLPNSVTSIGTDAFSGCSRLRTITVSRGSYAAQYCKENCLPYTYPDSLDWLNN